MRWDNNEIFIDVIFLTYHNLLLILKLIHYTVLIFKYILVF